MKYPIFAIHTREPSQELPRLHDRMPLILPASAIKQWIKPDADPEVFVRAAVTDMVFERALRLCHLKSSE